MKEGIRRIQKKMKINSKQNEESELQDGTGVRFLRVNMNMISHPEDKLNLSQ